MYGFYVVKYDKDSVYVSKLGILVDIYVYCSLVVLGPLMAYFLSYLSGV